MVYLFIRQNATFFLVNLYLHLSLCLCFVLPLSVHLSRYLYLFPSVNLSACLFNRYLMSEIPYLCIIFANAKARIRNWYYNLGL